MGQNEFHSILKVERARADREGPSFSLVLFEISEIYTDKYVKEFVELLKVRVRMVDYIGWFDANTIGVILFATELHGANQFILDVEKKTRTILPAYTIFSYPDHWLNRKDETAHKQEKADAVPVTAGGDSRSGNPRYSIGRIKDFFVTPVPLWKRIVDIAGSLFGILILSPVFILTALYIKIVSPGPVFFTQKRVGHKGELFTFFKFRTMKVNNDVSNHQAYLKSLIGGDAPMVKLDTEKKDSRVIPGGEILRKSCIDELPQLFNVLRGEMSLIGPRPCIEYEAKEFDTWHHQRFNILPGMTGLWQVSGKNSLTFKQMIRLDIVYGNRMSLWLDLKILLLTIPTVFGLIFDKLNKKLAAKKISIKPLHKAGEKILNFSLTKSTYRGEYDKERRKQSV
jgi:lipopolysaccharide/colanic/teichoic acid biosynthesis glycosyltransferase